MPELFKYCKFIVSDKLPNQNEKLRQYITDTLDFRITKHKPWTIEKENVTHQDCLTLMETLKAKYKLQVNDFVFVQSAERRSNQTLASSVSRTKKNEVGTKNISSDKTLGESNIQSSTACDSEDIKDIIDQNVSNQPSSFNLGCMEISETARKALVENLEYLLLGTPVVTAPLSLSSDVQAPQGSNGDNIIECTLRWTDDWNLKYAERYMSTESYKQFFENAITKDTQVIFRINRSDPEARVFLNKVKQLKFEKIGFNIRDNEKAMKLLKQVEGDTGTTMGIFNNFIFIVGMKEEVSRAKELITEKLQNLDRTEYDLSEFKYSKSMGRSSQAFRDEGNNAWRKYEPEENDYVIVFDSERHCNQSQTSMDPRTDKDVVGTKISTPEIMHGKSCKQNENTCAGEENRDISENTTEQLPYVDDEIETISSKFRDLIIFPESNTSWNKVEKSKSITGGPIKSSSESHVLSPVETTRVYTALSGRHNANFANNANDNEIIATEERMHQNATDAEEKNPTTNIPVLVNCPPVLIPSKARKDITAVTSKTEIESCDISSSRLIGGNCAGIECSKSEKSKLCGVEFDNKSSNKEQVSMIFSVNMSLPSQNLADSYAEIDEPNVTQLKPELISTTSNYHKSTDNSIASSQKLNTFSLIRSIDSSEIKYDQDKSYDMGGSSQAYGDKSNARGSEYDKIPTKTPGPESVNSKAVNVHAMSFRNNDTFSSTQRYQQQSSYHNPECFITEKCKLVVQIHKADITKFKADVIVNAANQRLQHAGGVAKAISVAAGWELKKYCEDYIKSGKIVNVTDMFQSKGGKLQAKCVFHAVGPKWDAYEDKLKCIDDLRHTVLRCLVEAGSQGVTSIAFPSISAAAFEIPELCARCYMEAVKHFDVFNAKEASPLHEIHFIDVDDTMINYITECFSINWNEICDPDKLKNDLDFAHAHLHSPFKTQTASNEKLFKSGIAKSPTSRASEEETAPTSGTVRSIKFRNFTLQFKSGYALDYPGGINITIGKPFDKLSGLSNFQIEQNLKKVDKMPYAKKCYRFYQVTKPGTKWSHLLLAVYPEPDTVEAIPEIFGNLEFAIQKCDKIGIIGRLMIITSHILYGDREGNHEGGKKYDSQKIEKFADSLHQYMEKLADTTQTNISITVVGDEDSLSVIQRVMESHIKQASEQEDLSTSQKCCHICFDEKKNVRPTRCCGELICSECEMRLSVCPFCHRFWKIIKGNQPDGSMKVDQISESADGFENCPTWRIEYNFPQGIQKDHHPNPGQVYCSCKRVAYLPANDEGFTVLILLRLSFIRRLTFTIGSSLTTNKEDNITWNDLHHKTSLNGGSCGYPDPTYLQRVASELADKSVSLDTTTEEERHDLDKFRFSLQIYRFFYKM